MMLKLFLILKCAFHTPRYFLCRSDKNRCSFKAKETLRIFANNLSPVRPLEDGSWVVVKSTQSLSPYQCTGVVTHVHCKKMVRSLLEEE
jgi:hypothetical protein